MNIKNNFEIHKRLYGNQLQQSRPLTAPIHVSYMGSIDETTNYDKEYEMLKSMEPHVTGHQQTIIRFGRFPKRNKALGRESTASEIAYMEQPEVQKRPY